MESFTGWVAAATVGSASMLAAARLLALLIVLRGTRPEERAPLVEALSVFFGRAGSSHRAGTPADEDHSDSSGVSSANPNKDGTVTGGTDNEAWTTSRRKPKQRTVNNVSGPEAQP